MIAQKGVRFSDTLARPMVPPPQPQWLVPSFRAPGNRKVPPPPPPRKEKALPSVFSGEAQTDSSSPAVLSEASSVTPKKSPPKLINAINNENGEFFASQSAIAMLSPISAITEVTEAAPVVGATRGTFSWHGKVEEIKEERFEEDKSPLSTSFETLNTIDMLNFDFLKKCTCAKDLGRIIRLLAQKSGSPQLLQAARKRLQDVQGKKLKAPPPPPPPRHRVAIVAVVADNSKVDQKEKKVKLNDPVDDEEEISPGKIFSDSNANISRITAGNTTLDSIDASRNSLNMSYSPPSVLRGLSLVDTPSQCRKSEISRLGTIAELSSSQPNDDAVESSRQKVLVDEVKNLSMDAADMQASQAHERTNFLEKLSALEEAKKEAESIVKTLQKKAGVVSAEREEAVKAMEQIQRKHQVMQEELLRERSRLQMQDREARSLEERMQGKIAELQNALKEEVERSKLVVGAEKSIRLQRESDLELQRERNIELNLLLRQTKENLERIKRTQDVFRKELLLAIGASEEEFKNVSDTEFVVQVAGKVRDMKAENFRLTEELQETQSKPNKAVEECDRLQKRIREVLSMNKELEEENVNLGSKIEVLSAEVTSSRALIDKLLKTSHETQANDWEKKEAQYQAAIRKYQQHIRKQASTVSLELYRAAVDDSRKTQSQLQSAERKIVDLKTKVSTLEKEGKVSEAAKTPNLRKSQPRNFMLSPTDYLEKGLLSTDFKYQYPHDMRQSSPHQGTPIRSPFNKPKTPVSQIQTGLHVEVKMTDKTPAKNKETAKREYLSPVENIYLKASVIPSPLSVNVPSPHQTEQSVSPQRAQPVHHSDALTGMTIYFQTPSGLSTSPKSMASPWPMDEVPLVADINEWVEQYNQKFVTYVEKKKDGENAAADELYRSDFETYKPSKEHKTPILSPCWKANPMKRPVTFTKSFQTPASKENQAHKISPNSGSKTFRMQKARELGGMKGLRSELNRIRSPQSLGKPKRVARVLGERLVN